MTHGRITTKDGKNTLTGEFKALTGKYGDFRPDGTDNWMAVLKSEWNFVEDKPSAYEQIEAMEPGTIFEAQWGTQYIKLTDSQVWSMYRNFAFKNAPGQWPSSSSVTVVRK